MKPSVVQNQNKNRRGSKYGGVRMKIAGTPHSSILIVDDDPLVSELGREPINLQAVRLARVRYCPDCDKFRSAGKWHEDAKRATSS
jgi:hypothetical protein